MWKSGQIFCCHSELWLRSQLEDYSLACLLPASVIFFSPSEFGHLFCCLQSFKKLDCFSLIKITHASDLPIASSQGERGIWGQCGAAVGSRLFSLSHNWCMEEQSGQRSTLQCALVHVSMDWTRSLKLSPPHLYTTFLFFHPLPLGQLSHFLNKRKTRGSHSCLSVWLLGL